MLLEDGDFQESAVRDGQSWIGLTVGDIWLLRWGFAYLLRFRGLGESEPLGELFLRFGLRGVPHERRRPAEGRPLLGLGLAHLQLDALARLTVHEELSQLPYETCFRRHVDPYTDQASFLIISRVARTRWPS